MSFLFRISYYLELAPGWLGFRVVLNTFDLAYATMKTGFDKYWKLQTNQTNSSVPIVESSASFNAIVAIVHTLDTMFIKSKPAVYVSSPVPFTHSLRCGLSLLP